MMTLIWVQLLSKLKALGESLLASLRVVSINIVAAFPIEASMRQLAFACTNQVYLTPPTHGHLDHLPSKRAHSCDSLR